MRLDKYLKVSRIIKRRTIAKEVCESGKVYVNDKQAKPGTDVEAGDVIVIKYASKELKAKITMIEEHTKKEKANLMYEIIEGEQSL